MANATKTAIVTGASRGIGAGSRRSVPEARLQRSRKTRENITKANPFSVAANVALVDGDIGDPRTAARIVENFRIAIWPNRRTGQQCGRFFIPKPFTEYTTEDFNTLVFHDNLQAFLYVSQLAVKANAAAEVRQQSSTSQRPLVDQPIAGVGAAVQIMLKGALNAVTRALAIEYAKGRHSRKHRSAGRDQYSDAQT